MPELPEMYRYFDKDLQLTIKIPQGWHPAVNEAFKLIIFAPLQDNYQANLGLNLNQLEPATLPSLKELFEQAQQQQKRHKYYQLTRFEPLQIDGCDGFLQGYDWLDESSQLHFSQLQVAVLLNPPDPSILSISGSSLMLYKTEYLDVLEKMINSIQLIQLTSL